MSPYTVLAICARCGGPGQSMLKAAAEEWDGMKLVHSDTRACRYYRNVRQWEKK